MQGKGLRAVILSGGAGTRLWPLSRQGRPKQFIKMGAEHSFLQSTILRCSGGPFFETPILIGANEHRLLLSEEVDELGKKAKIILEPIARNTCAAIAAACFFQSEIDPDIPLLILAADHWIEDVQAFKSAASKAKPLAEAGYLVTFGVEPTEPSTGYGYIRKGEK